MRVDIPEGPVRSDRRRAQGKIVASMRLSVLVLEMHAPASRVGTTTLVLMPRPLKQEAFR